MKCLEKGALFNESFIFSYDYGDDFWSAKIERDMFCCCGSTECKYSEPSTWLDIIYNTKLLRLSAVSTMLSYFFIFFFADYIVENLGEQMSLD